MTSRILIIDDDFDIVEPMKIVLEANGYTVLVAYTIEEGEAMAKQNNPNVIILDVMFPGKQDAGFELSRKLKNDSATQTIPILMYSAVGQQFHMHFGADKDFNPVDDFIDKPIKPDVLLAKVKALITK